MHRFIFKLFWTLCTCCCLITPTTSQSTRIQTRNRARELPTAIITREHLRRRAPLYGNVGDTAAEFVVSAGLDTSKSSVRIRKIGNPRGNSTQSVKPIRNEFHRPGLPNFSDEHRRHHLGGSDQQFRTPTIAHHPPQNLHPQFISRRQYHDNDAQQNVYNTNSYHRRVPVRKPQIQNAPAYIPPITPYRQAFSPARHASNPRTPAIHPFDVQYRRPEKSPEVYSNSPRIFPVNPNHSSYDEGVNVTSTPLRNDKFGVNGPESDDKYLDKNKETVVRGDQRVPILQPTDKNIIAETPVLHLKNNVKVHDFRGHIAQNPPLELKDELFVNEVTRRSNVPRYGPRSLEYREEIEPIARHKRESKFDSSDWRENRTSVIFDDSADDFKGNVSYYSRQYDIDGGFVVAKEADDDNTKSFVATSKSSEEKLSNYQNTNSTSLKYGSLNKPSGYFDDDELDFYQQETVESTGDDIMSFSDFLASPIAEKIRLQRQMFFRNSSLFNESSRNNQKDSFLKNITLLRNIIAARLLQNILNFAKSPQNATLKSRSTNSPLFDHLAPAEQRQLGIVVAPYEGTESITSKSSMPVIRILKGKIVSLPELPQELIPIILGTYNPTYTTEANYNDDSKLSENIIENAIYTLLQNEDLLNIRPVVPREPYNHHLGNRGNRKSPSTNYVGSMKSEPLAKPTYNYKPGEWSLGPRCDRLTEEICLDDSDYPSSAIMSSIYKDKAKFDLMYAEVKVRESQVEGLSRKQEQAYSFDHYYGAFPQAAGSNLVPRDYGPNGGFVCPSEVHYGRPHRAKNRKGEWKVVVNVGEYTQTVRMEKCLASGNPCKYVVSHLQSTCSQVYSYHRLLVFNKELGLHIDVFRVPTSCTCHLRPGQPSFGGKFSASSPFLHRPNPYEEFGGHVETAPAPLHAEGSHNSNDKRKNSFSSTLWAILGGGQKGGSLAQEPQFLDEVQKQISWTQQLKQFPQLLKQISPNQVLKQLLEEDDEEFSIRRQRIRPRPTMDHMTSNGYASHQMPMAIPLPPLPPPPRVMQRRPVVNMAPPSMEQKHLFTSPSDGQAKVIAVTSSEPTKTFSFLKNASPISNTVKLSTSENGQRNVFNMVPVSSTLSGPSFKVHPGMYPPSSEKQQVPEDSFLPMHSHYSESSSGFRPVLKPMPAPKGSEKKIVEDEDLMAVEKSAESNFSIESPDEQLGITEDNNDSKINFSYHPILEYLNL